MTELHKVMKKYLEVNNCYPCNTFWEEQIREAIKTDEQSEPDVEALVRPKIGEVKWENRYSTTLENDKMGRWMRIGRVNSMTIAIITKATNDETKETRFVVKVPNDNSDESIQTHYLTMTEDGAKERAETHIKKYISKFFA